MLLPGRAIELDKKTAEKYIEAYPNDLIEFDSLLTGKKKDLLSENRALETELEESKISISLSLEENEKLKLKITELEKKAVENNKTPDKEKA